MKNYEQKSKYSSEKVYIREHGSSLMKSYDKSNLTNNDEDDIECITVDKNKFKNSVSRTKSYFLNS